MPADDEHGRRQITLQQQQQHAAPSPITVQCSTNCVSSSADLCLQQEHRYSSDKNILDAPDRFPSVAERFGSERSNSDRLPSGERYQGVSERYPLGERPQTSVSSERLISKEILQTSGHCQNERYHYADRTPCQRYPERFTPVQNVGSLDRYHSHATMDRYSRTNTPTDRYHTLSTEKERSTDRYTPIEKYQSSTMETLNNSDRHSSTQNMCSIDCYTPTERHRSSSKSDIYKVRERSSSSDRRDRHHNREQYQNRYDIDQYVPERYSTDRFPPIPCPERFASQERTERSERLQFAQVPYMEPPSPAPANDRFIPPPPLSPDNTPSPDCFPNNAFPSPTTTVSPPDRFIPPPPLSPSPTENFSPKKVDRYDKQSRFNERYTSSPNSDRYNHHHHHEQRFKDRNQYYNDRYSNSGSNSYHSHSNKYVNNQDRYNSGDRYVPPNAHMPVERYVPQQQEPYYNSYQTYERLGKFNNSDPYTRRDLAFQYRLPITYTPNQYQRLRYSQVGTPNRVKCCQYQDGYQLSKSSPGSSSSSSVTSQGKDFHQKEIQCVNNVSLQEMQCQNYQQGYQQSQQQQQQHHQLQEKGTQCGNLQCQQIAVASGNNKECVGFVSPNLRNVKGQCRHNLCVSPSVEYVGASGGRHVCATPPPRGSIGSGDGSVCNDSCCTRRSQTSLTVAVWRSTPQPQQQHVPQQQTEPTTQSPLQQSQTRSTTPVINHDITSENQQNDLSETTPKLQVSSQQQLPRIPPQRAVSSPPVRSRQLIGRPVGYSQSERIPNKERPPLNRSMSRKEILKNYLKRETATFFGVDEENQDEQQMRWLDRRKRMATRTMGPLKEEFRTEGRTYRPPSEIMSSPVSGQLIAERPDVLPGPSDVADNVQERTSDVTLRRKDSVARMTWNGLSYVVTTLARQRPRVRSQQDAWSRSYPPETPNQASTSEEQTFFEKPALPSSPHALDGGGDTVDRELSSTLQASYRDREREREQNPRAVWRRDHQDVILRHGENRPTVGGSRITSSTLDHVLDNSNRREFGMGWVGRMFGRSVRKSVAQDDKIRQQLDDMEDHRPMFTYWVTIVQILVLFISLICYGFGPFGVDLQSRSGQVLVTSLSLQQVDYMEPANFWFGPRASDLIHLGAKFAPCMRVDDKISQQIEAIRLKERETACCIRNDDSGCVQSSQADCSKTISTWKKWKTGDAGPGGRISGSVCGLDPKFCDAPASVHPYEWPDDITKWPICRKTNTQYSTQKRPRDKLAEHMVCEVIGHPCCIGIHGQCKITTKEYCDFVRGAFHEEASLCSQVSCLNDVCGMLPFYFPDVPDQFYRLWTSLFLHAGILQLVITVLIQYFLMRDLEKLTGSLRIGIIYIGSGVAGNLASAIFVPYRADVGPAGSQFGLLACLIVEVLNAWPMLKHPNKALCKLLLITLFLFVIGLLPWVDNYAHLFGFVFGFLLSYALLPFISFGQYDRQKKILLIWICLVATGILFICLVLLFYIIPVYDCKICSYFNCLPLTRDFCASQNINFKREEPIV